MVSMVDRGDSYHVIYLGSCMLSQMATGLGALQKPLRELYFKYRQSGGGPAAQERYLLMSGKGMTMTYKETTAAQPTEVFYTMPSILFWDAVQFATVRTSDKKVKGAFEPLDNDQSRNKDNLFAMLEKKYYFLQQMTHPPLFACVLRRTSGVKALDVHAFVCSSDDEAVGLVRALNNLQSSYKTDEVQETGVFGYRPFGGGQDGGGSGAPGGATSADKGSQPDLRRNAASGSFDRPVSRASSTRHLSGPVDKPAPTNKSSSDKQKQQPAAPRSVRQPSPNVTRSGVYKLTQQDFQVPREGSPSPPRSPTKASTPSKKALKKTQDHVNEDEHVYQYIRHIQKSLPRNAGAIERILKEQHSAISASSLADRNKEGDIRRGSGDNKGPKPVAPVRYQNNKPPVATPNKIQRSSPSPTKLGQGYSFLSGSGSPLPGQHDYSRDHQDRVRDDNNPSYSPSHLRSVSPSYETELPTDNSIPRPSVTPHYRGSRYEYDQDDYEREGQSSSGYSPRAAERPRALQREETHVGGSPSNSRYSNSSSSPYQSRSAFGVSSPPGRTPDPHNRPVAKVPPHKVSGVKVLPTGPNQPRSPIKSPVDNRPRTTYYDDTAFSGLNSGRGSSGKNKNDYGLPPRRSRSQYFDDPSFQAEINSSPSNNRYESNWKFKPSTKSGYDYRTVNKDGNDESEHMNEKLLLGQKKDAEIASVMQNLRFEYDASTLSPGMPAGNNFEKSLGYFP